jgi:uncharacterized protein YcbX
MDSGNVDVTVKKNNKADADTKTGTNKEAWEKEWLAYQRLLGGMPTEEEDHLNLTLEHEATFSREYQTLLANLWSICCLMK